MDRIRIGVIGLGFGRFHVRTLANMEEAELVAIADTNPDLPGGLEGYAAGYGAKAYRDGIEMMEKEELDAVSLCVSPAFREPLIEQAAKKGIAMLVEKPWATDLEHARRLAAICRQGDATVMTAFSFRFHPVIIRLRELMDGDLGSGWMLNGEYIFGWNPPSDHWLWTPDNGNGFLNENSCHLFDAVCHLMGEPVSVMAEGRIFMDRPSEDGTAIVIRFASGGIAALTCGGIGTGGYHEYPRLDVVTANGQAKLLGREHIWEELTWTTRDSSEVKQVIQPPEGLGNTRYTDAMRHFFACIRTGEKPSATIADGVRMVGLAMGIYESMRTGARVQLET